MRLEEKIQIDGVDHIVKELRIRDVIQTLDIFQSELALYEKIKQVIYLAIPDLKPEEIQNITMNDITQIIDIYRNFFKTYETTLEFLGIKDQLYEIVNKKKQSLITSFVQIIA